MEIFTHKSLERLNLCWKIWCWPLQTSRSWSTAELSSSTELLGFISYWCLWIHHCPTIWPACLKKSLSRWPVLLWFSVWLPSLQRALMALMEAAAISQPLHKASAAKGKLIGQTSWQGINLLRLRASSKQAQPLFFCFCAMGVWALIGRLIVRHNISQFHLRSLDLQWLLEWWLCPELHKKHYIVNILTTQQSVQLGVAVCFKVGPIHLLFHSYFYDLLDDIQWRMTAHIGKSERTKHQPHLNPWPLMLLVHTSTCPQDIPMVVSFNSNVHNLVSLQLNEGN